MKTKSRTLHCNTLKAGYTVLTGKKVIVLIYDYQNFLYYCSIVSLHCTCDQSHVVRDGPIMYWKQWNNGAETFYHQLTPHVRRTPLAPYSVHHSRGVCFIESQLNKTTL